MAELVGHNLASEFVLCCCAVTSVIAARTKSAAQRAGRGDVLNILQYRQVKKQMKF